MQDGVRSGLAILLAANRIIAQRAASSSKKLISAVAANDLGLRTLASDDRAEHSRVASRSSLNPKATLDDLIVSGNDAERAIADAVIGASSQPSSALKDVHFLQSEGTARRHLQSSAVPSSRIARMLQYGSLAAGLGLGSAASLMRGFGGGQKDRSPLMSEANLQRIVRSLSRMRGAALKIGQFLSIQESNILPPQLEQVLARMQNAAEYMPQWQTEEVLRTDLGEDWRSHFTAFDMQPIAAASIGQVHSAILNNGQRVAVKVQFPGVADSIKSDISNLGMLLSVSALLPKGLFLQNSLAVMKEELSDECDYIREAEACRTFGKLLADDEQFYVPEIIDRLSTARVFTTDFLDGKTFNTIADRSQEFRDMIGSAVMRLCLLELFQYRAMQTDPNYSNFLWNDQTNKIELLDFGATRYYSQQFVDQYKALLLAAIKHDRDACVQLSRDMGYLTDADNEIMIEAHVDAMLLLAEPFRHESYNFGGTNIAQDVRSFIPIMLKHRTTPPPTETYSLNRKLSGAFLLCTKLRSKVSCRDILEKTLG